MKLIFCLGGNKNYISIARSAGWHIGARLPCMLYEDYQPLAFADQDWRLFAGMAPIDARYQHHYQAYVAFVATHRPQMASVVDWEVGRELDEVLTWAHAIAPHVNRVVIIPKIPDRVSEIPAVVDRVPVVLGVSIPTRHGSTSCMPIEFAGRPVHLLGGSIRQQLQWAGTLAGLGCTIVSADGNAFHRAAGRGTFWNGDRWCNLGPHAITTNDALTRSLFAIPETWRKIGWEIENFPAQRPANR